MPVFRLTCDSSDDVCSSLMYDTGTRSGLSSCLAASVEVISPCWLLLGMSSGRVMVLAGCQTGVLCLFAAKSSIVAKRRRLRPRIQVGGFIRTSEPHESQASSWQDACIRYMWAQEWVEIVEVGLLSPDYRCICRIRVRKPFRAR